LQQTQLLKDLQEDMSWLINFEDLEFGDRLGQGAFGVGTFDQFTHPACVL